MAAAGAFSSGAVSLFISYSHKDEALLDEFLTHLSPLQRERVIQAWHDRKITPGKEWAGVIDQNMETARIIVLLISPDFLASDYCNDVELKRALERHESGAAVVVPVILRPADWTTARFAKLQALPKDGRPVVIWPMSSVGVHDEGFLDVVRGLRGIAGGLQPLTEITEVSQVPINPVPPVMKTEVPEPVVRPKARRLPVLTLIALSCLAAGVYWKFHRPRAVPIPTEYLEQARRRLDVGRYEDAREFFNRALQVQANDAEATLGLAIVDLSGMEGGDTIRFEQHLNDLLKRSPRDPYLKMFHGDLLLRQRQADDAMKEYTDVLQTRPTLAEAYFRRGVLYDKADDRENAVEMYRQAALISPASSKYETNLADQYVRAGEASSGGKREDYYRQAIATYAGIAKCPLAAIETGKLYRRTGQLESAIEKVQLALEWQSQEKIASTPENRQPWYFRGEVRVVSDSEKMCYAASEASATAFLAAKTAQAKNYGNEAQQTCGTRYAEIQRAVLAELEHEAQERPGTSRIQAYREDVALRERQ